MKNNYHVIIAGGSGSRFWPKSRQRKPKQLLKIFNKNSMIRLTFNRIKSISNPSNILIVASRKICVLIMKELPEVPSKNFIIEPSRKNTAPAIGLAAAHILSRNKNAVMSVYPADHLITDTLKFNKIINKGINFVKSNPSIVTLGIKPSFPSSGYGYIQFCENLSDENEIYKVKTFAEKPNIKTAQRFLNSGEFLWNSGIFIFKVQTILSEMKTHMSELHESLLNIYKACNKNEYDVILKKEWDLIKPESIDYGIMEKVKDTVYTIKADFGWSDMGTWKSIYDLIPKDEKGMIAKGNTISIKSKNSLILSEEKLTAIIGLEDIAIINTNDATLVMPINMAEHVKKVVDHLKMNGMDEFL